MIPRKGQGHCDRTFVAPTFSSWLLIHKKLGIRPVLVILGKEDYLKICPHFVGNRCSSILKVQNDNDPSFCAYHEYVSSSRGKACKVFLLGLYVYEKRA